MKRCATCGKRKKLAGFYAHRASPQGVRRDCKECMVAAKALVASAVTVKTCRCCQRVRSREDFYEDSRYRDGLRNMCIDCATVAGRETMRKTRSLNRQDHWRRDVVSSKECSRCRRTCPSSDFRQNRSSGDGLQAYCKACADERKKIANRALREAVLEHYGKECACCGESHYEFLVLDHEGGGGNQHRRALGREGGQFYRWVIKRNFPDGLRVLCHNCNMAHGNYGFCPHELELSAEETVGIRDGV